MYRFSRAIYRDLAAEIVEDPHGSGVVTNHERVLRACEAAVERTGDRSPLLRSSRPHSVLRHSLVLPDGPAGTRATGDRALRRAADEFLQRQPQNGYDANGNPLQCRATTRKGTPCQRMPLPQNGYCPSHQHLAETEEELAALAA